MSTAEKLLERMRNSQQDWRIDELKTVARAFGIE
jgi:hypothetical protein